MKQSPTWRDQLDPVVAALANAQRVAVLSGAGMSADSGLPTYRGSNGLYNAIEIEQNMPIEEILHAYTSPCVRIVVASNEVVEDECKIQ